HVWRELTILINEGRVARNIWAPRRRRAVWIFQRSGVYAHANALTVDGLHCRALGGHSLLGIGPKWRRRIRARRWRRTCCRWWVGWSWLWRLSGLRLGRVSRLSRVRLGGIPRSRLGLSLLRLWARIRTGTGPWIRSLWRLSVWLSLPLSLWLGLRNLWVWPL